MPPCLGAGWQVATSIPGLLRLLEKGERRLEPWSQRERKADETEGHFSGSGGICL